MVLMVFRTHTNLSIMSQQNLVLSRFVQLLKNMSCLNPKKWVGTRFSYIFAFLLVHRACSPNWISLTQWRNKTTLVSKSKFTFLVLKVTRELFIIIVKLVKSIANQNEWCVSFDSFTWIWNCYKYHIVKLGKAFGLFTIFWPIFSEEEKMNFLPEFMLVIQRTFLLESFLDLQWN